MALMPPNTLGSVMKMWKRLLEVGWGGGYRLSGYIDRGLFLETVNCCNVKVVGRPAGSAGDCTGAGTVGRTGRLEESTASYYGGQWTVFFLSWERLVSGSSKELAGPESGALFSEAGVILPLLLYQGESSIRFFSPVF
ncbi:hypothetical protein GWI33_008010 [Rhynchophorus ferrugineus]|uniref:Uncharacterized protein n=1 Tax=Rhynchophorus ferrugineus TaxID=354439 RepID=A0A834IFC3_RHYFE|nr:hypothetical protein GWI33_008010 [Rhynchophorus ferrugineus]